MGKMNFPKDAFQKWYWYDRYSLTGSRGEWMADDPTAKFMHDMVEAAFLEGCRWMAQETCDTLGDYATALEGCGPETQTPSHKYDDVRDSLLVYFTKILDNMEVEQCEPTLTN